MAWGIIIAGFTLFGMLVLIILKASINDLSAPVSSGTDPEAAVLESAKRWKAA